MAQIEAALAALIGFHQQLGVAIEPTLLPPATEVDIQRVESVIGFQLPDDLRELYKIANGQVESYESEEVISQLLESNKSYAPLFGYYVFLPLDEALAEYEYSLKTYTSDLEYNKKYNEANPGSDRTFNEWYVREGDPVDAFGWNPNWFPFARASSDHYNIDMTPLPGGTVGQVVEDGPDVAELSVVAASVTELMEQAVRHLDPTEENRYERSERGSDRPAAVYFDIDWRNEPYDENNPANQVSAEHEAWVNEQMNQLRQRQAKLKVWLAEQGLNELDAVQVASWSQSHLDVWFHPTPPNSVLNANAASQEETRYQSNSGNDDPDTAFNWQLYFGKLSSAVFMSKSVLNTISSNVGEGLAVSEAIDLLHRYYRDTQIWTLEEFQRAENVRAQFELIEPEGAGGFQGFISSAGETSITICQSKFDSDTYKSEEICNTVDTEPSQ